MQAEETVMNANKSAQTNASGRFMVGLLPMSLGKVRHSPEKGGSSSESDEIQWLRLRRFSRQDQNPARSSPVVRPPAGLGGNGIAAAGRGASAAPAPGSFRVLEAARGCPHPDA